MPTFRMNSESESPRMRSGDCVRTASVHTHASSRRGQGAVGEFVAATGHHVERVRPIDALEIVPVFWVGARQRAEREQPRHEAQLGVRFARGDELRHLVELREVSRLASPRRLDGFGRQRGKIAVGGRRHLECLLSASGAMGINRRAQTFVRVHFRSESIPRPAN